MGWRMLVAGGQGGVQDRRARQPRVLFLCWEKLARDPVAQRLVTQSTWPFQVCAVETREEWRRHGFSFQVDQIDALLEDFTVAVAHGYDAWVLMAAAEQRAVRGAAVPFLLLLNPVLGASQHLNGFLVGYRAPRGPRVRSAFGLDPDEDGLRALTSKVAYVFGDNDRYSSERDWSYLRGLGCRVFTVRGWHPRHRREIEEQLEEIIGEYSREVAAALATALLSSESSEPDDPLRVAAGT